MVKINKYFLFILIFSVFCSGFVVAEFADCMAQEPQFGGSRSSCNAIGCLWASDNSSEFSLNITDIYDPFCGNSYCCFPKSCWQYDGTNESFCETNDGTLNCTWDPFMQIYAPNGSLESVGGCFNDWASGGDWGGMDDGCWNNDADKESCTGGANAAKCSWASNGANENPWCFIKSLGDAQMKNPLATSTDVGCCEQKGCWSYDGNQTACEGAFNGNCFYETGGWCNTKWCGEITDETNCTYVNQNLYMPCAWNVSGTGLCEDSYGDGGFGFFNTTDSCFDAGGWYNSTGDCIMPTTNGAGTGGGAFLFGGEATCWFADNQQNVCGNLTGCAYCVAGSGVNGVDNSSADNICYRKGEGLCEGHDVYGGLYSNANNSASLICTDIGVKSACKYGPLPNCKWTNSSINVGAYCVAGTSSEKKAEPPVPFCEHPDSKNNFSLCNELISDYMMPCVWQNTTYPITNCTFNGDAVFGEGNEKDFGIINSESSCLSAGGSWNTEYYVDAGILKQDSWCEMTGFFDIDNKEGEGNKGNCDTNCWACEFQNDGSVWADVSAVEAACEASVAVGGSAGGCVWFNNSNSFNGFGFCDFPKEMEDGGAKDCNLECEGCNFAGDPQFACEGSMANSGVGCQWVSEGSNNYCVDKTKKVCANDCFSCYGVDSCQNSSLSCSWDSGSGICSPDGFTGEVCFDGIDNDADNLVDCGDPDCGFDNFCGGSSFGGDCFAQITEGTCNQTIAFDSLNCTWINDTWNPSGWCDMPGSNCWKFDDDLETCGATSGCTNDTTSMGDDAWCEMNWTKMDSSNCWNNDNESSCGVALNCQWVNDTWCSENPSDQWCIDNPSAGWCDYAPFASCMNLNISGCSANVNCTWQEDEYSMMGGWCDVACFDWDLNETGCGAAAGGVGLCEWRNMSATCQPSTFMMFGKGDDGKSGCWQYDGNQTACLENDIVCTYKNDSYSSNNVSVVEPAGWCMDKSEHEHFGEVEGDVIDLAMDVDNFLGAESGVADEVDLMGMGMRVTDIGFNFGAGVYNISDSIICNGYKVADPNDPFGIRVEGIGNSSSKFYWYLDTSGNSSDGCVAVQSGAGANLTGYDFMISYVARNTSSGVSETKQLMRCLDGSWVPTNALVTTSKKLSCGEIGGVMVAVSKQDIESFSEYNKTANMKIFMSSANDTDSRISPSDSIGPGYYTPGTIDFAFVDCSDPNNAKDAKCKNFQKFGFNVYEECKNNIDDDENGLIDCDDPFCSFIPDCNDGVGFSFVSDSNDVVAPVVMFSDVEKLADSAFVKIDTSEPSNLSLQFYLNDSDCERINATVSDVGAGYQANANFKPFHSVDLLEDTLGYVLTNGTTYYYKIKVCDPSNNCGVSECSNFTTKTSVSAKPFIFKMDLPDGFTVDIPALNKTNYNFTENFGGTNYDVGIKTNTSVTKDMNMTIHCGDLSLGFYGMNVLGPVNIDLSNAFICDESEDLIGMNSTGKKWNKLVNDLRLGGANDYIEIGIPIAYSTNNTFNWTDDSGASGQDVDDYVECSGDSSETNCKVPVSMGFSAYTITLPVSSPPGDDGSNGGSSGGSGGVILNNSVVDNVTEVENDSVVESDTPEDEEVEEKAEEAEIVKNKLFIWLIVSLGSIVAIVVGTVFWRKKFRKS